MYIPANANLYVFPLTGLLLGICSDGARARGANGLSKPDDAADVGNGLALVEELLSGAQHADDLLGCVAFAAHGASPAKSGLYMAASSRASSSSVMSSSRCMTGMVGAPV